MSRAAAHSCGKTPPLSRVEYRARVCSYAGQGCIVPRIDTAGKRTTATVMSRLVCLGSCFVLTLGCGTVYAFSAYAPQLASQLDMNVKTISLVGMVANFAQSVSGPFAGMLVDRRGFALPIALSVLFGCGGYALLNLCYHESIASVPLLCAAMVLVGAGSTCGFSAAIKCAATNFPNMRGTATAITMSGYGLSTFVMSMLAQLAARTPLLRDSADASVILLVLLAVPTALEVVAGPALAQFYRPPQRGAPHQQQHQRQPSRSGVPETGFQLVRYGVFWMYFLVLGLLAGMGQAYIYTCGHMVKALLTTISPTGGRIASKPELVFSPAAMASMQASQVALLSVANCGGRLLGGLLSDALLYRMHASRVNAMFAAVVLCLLANAITAHVSDIRALWLPTLLVGTYYGMTVGTLPGVISDEFGVQNLSSNWGTVALAPIPFSTYFTLRIGRIFDAHADSNGVCFGGACFNSAYYLHLALGVLVLVLLGAALNLESGGRYARR